MESASLKTILEFSSLRTFVRVIYWPNKNSFNSSVAKIEFLSNSDIARHEYLMLVSRCTCKFIWLFTSSKSTLKICHIYIYELENFI